MNRINGYVFMDTTEGTDIDLIGKWLDDGTMQLMIVGENSQIHFACRMSPEQYKLVCSDMEYLIEHGPWGLTQ